MSNKNVMTGQLGQVTQVPSPGGLEKIIVVSPIIFFFAGHGPAREARSGGTSG
jgi:hypothetical protein